MSFLEPFIGALKRGETVQFRPRGNSMKGRIKSGALVTVEPCTTPKEHDAVVCRVKGTCYVHLVKAVRGDEFLIGNMHGKINGWTKEVFGRVIKVEP